MRRTLARRSAELLDSGNCCGLRLSQGWKQLVKAEQDPLVAVWCRTELRDGEWSEISVARAPVPSSHKTVGVIEGTGESEIIGPLGAGRHLGAFQTVCGTLQFPEWASAHDHVASLPFGALRSTLHAPTTASLSDGVQRHGAVVPVAPVLEQVDSLPRPEHQSTRLHGNGELRLGQDGANVSRHVVGPLRGVSIESIVLGHQPLEERLDVANHVGVGVLLERERR